MKTRILLSLLVAFAALSSGCAGIPGQLPDMAELEKRAQAFWSARVTNDLFAAYEFEDLKPLGTVTLQKYVQRGGAMQFKKAAVTGSECPKDSEICIVKVDVEYIIPMLGTKPFPGEVKDQWHVIDGEWYRTGNRSSSPVRNWKSE